MLYNINDGFTGKRAKDGSFLSFPEVSRERRLESWGNRFPLLVTWFGVIGSSTATTTRVTFATLAAPADIGASPLFLFLYSSGLGHIILYKIRAAFRSDLFIKLEIS